MPSSPSNKKSMNPFALFSKSAPRLSMCSGFSMTFGSRTTFEGPFVIEEAPASGLQQPIDFDPRRRFLGVVPTPIPRENSAIIAPSE
ncbi:hypothetical protein J2856_004071 [Agrobacterium tumefaciens]|nr:hypothetical protein [Agrobacterium tumefaciens]MBP2596559.1 hypothetical protein [Agrobacterium tumefaciens]MDP9857907.1 hypothetical protein [Agrobacterium tumefaciens]